ncbi:GNAT family N-acetyltransferase [Azospirillum argentinense]
MTALTRNISIRALARDDVPEVIDLLQSCHRRPDGTVPPRYGESHLRRMLFDATAAICPHGSNVLVAVVDGDIVGVVAYRSAFISALGWEIAYWGTSPRHQGHGVGGRLLDAALTQIRHGAAPDHFVLVRTAHPAAFARRGFHPLPDDAALMRAQVRSLRLATLENA